MEKYPLDSYIDINRARSEFFLKGNLPTELMPEPILISWQRSVESGVDVDGTPSEKMLLSGTELEELIFRNRMLLENSKPVMENLYEQVRDSSIMVILADKNGVILLSFGGIEFFDRARRIYLLPGGIWSEEVRGTNAIGTALVDRQPVRILGGEHFASVNKSFSCCSSPILDPFGNVLGVLDVTGDYRAYQQHTLALVRISTQLIEHKMFVTGFKDDVLLHFHNRVEFIGSLNEAIAVFTVNGKLKAANSSALQIMGLDSHYLGIDFADLFNIQFHSLLVRAGKVLEFKTKNGENIFARLKMAAANLRKPATEKMPASHRSQFQITLEGLHFGDSTMKRAIERVRRVIDQDITILLEGESGTGKELFAKAIHNSGPRSDKNFLALNCAAIPEGLIEAELFGYQDGAFTGARRGGSIGLIRQANGGTLLLDEVGDMPLSLQARLLRVLQERVVTPLGGVETFPVNIVIICATNRNLRKEVAAGRFREDLYYRINGLLVSLPRLRDREDLLRLAHAITEEIATPGRTIRIGEKVVEIMKRHPWPGNIRQMHSVMKTAVALLGNEEEIMLDHLSEDFLEQYKESLAIQEPKDPSMNTSCPSPLSLDKMEIMAIMTALRECGNNHSAAARRLGISRNTLYRKLREDAAQNNSQRL